jgi:hypothetical protein
MERTYKVIGVATLLSVTSGALVCLYGSSAIGLRLIAYGVAGGLALAMIIDTFKDGAAPHEVVTILMVLPIMAGIAAWIESGDYRWGIPSFIIGFALAGIFSILVD